jgi:ABC-type multidrug transport system fused ATPase/permease subunit
VLKSLRISLSFLSRRERIKYFLLVSVRALTGILDVAGIALIGFISGIAAASLDPTQPLTILGFTMPQLTGETLLGLVVSVLIVFVGKALLAVTLARSIAQFLARIESEQAEKIAAFLLNGTLGELQKRTKGEILWSVMGSASFAFTGLMNSLSILITEGLLLILIGLTFIAVDPMATVFVIVYFGLIVVVIQLFVGGRLKIAGQEAVEGNARSATAIDDVIGSFREIAVLRKQAHFVKAFARDRSRLSQSDATYNFLSGMPRYVVETALMLGVVMFVGVQFATGQLAQGLVTVGVFLTGGVRIMGSLLPLQNAVANIRVQVEKAQTAQGLLSDQRGKPALPLPDRRVLATIGELSTSGTGFSLELDRVEFTYDSAESPALRNVSMSIEGGQHVAIIGPSGAGKTTLVDLMLGLIQPTSGKVSINGIDPLILTDAQPGLISYVPQNPGLVSGTIAENIALGLDSEQIDYDKVDAAVKAAFLEEYISSLPEGIHTSVGKQGDALSGGQVQRLGLARALYEQPRLIILDEATSALDATSEAFVAQSLRNLGKNVTVVVIAHRLSTVQHSDVVYVVEGGAITASGSFSKLRKTVPMVAEYVKLMSFDNK